MNSFVLEETDENQYMLVNVIEELVKSKVREIMAEYDMCRCEKCYLDTCAIVLNSLKSQYVTGNKDLMLEMLSDTELQYINEMRLSILRALKLVKLYPRH